MRDTLDILATIPLTPCEVPAGPGLRLDCSPEWNIRDAYIKTIPVTPSSISNSPTCVLGYSTPSWHVLARTCCHTRSPCRNSPRPSPTGPPITTGPGASASRTGSPKIPRPRPVRGSISMPISTITVTCHLRQCLLPGASQDEILISTHICHPSLANDNCAGLATAPPGITSKAMPLPLRRVRFLFIPSTIGAITWLARSGARPVTSHPARDRALTVDPAPPVYKRSAKATHPSIRRSPTSSTSCTPTRTASNRSLPTVDEREDSRARIQPADRPADASKYGEFHQYHNSLDNLDFITPPPFSKPSASSSALHALLENRVMVNQLPSCRTATR